MGTEEEAQQILQLLGEAIKEVPLSQGKTTLVDDADYEQVVAYDWKTQKAGQTFYGTRLIHIDGKAIRYYLHRHILGVSDRNLVVDHIDHNGLNNQRHNLRICTNKQNSINSLPKKTYNGINVRSPYKGVTYKGGAYVASCHHHHLGCFQNEVTAARLYDVAAIHYDGDFACLNFPHVDYVGTLEEKLLGFLLSGGTPRELGMISPRKGHKYKGVSFSKASNVYKALCRKKVIGTFTTEEEAARAYDVAAREIYGELTYQNFPQ